MANVVFQYSPEYVSTLAKWAVGNSALIDKLGDFKRTKSENPIQPFGKNDTRLVSDAPLGRAVPGIRHAHLTQDLSVFYTVSGANPHVISLFGVYSHNESGTGNSQNIKVQKQLGKRMSAMKFVGAKDQSKTLDEAPLADYVPMGDFAKPGPFRGPDKKLVPHPVNQLKTAKFFEKTPYDFRLFFSNIPGTGKYAEYGPMRHEVIQEIFKDQAQQIIQGSENAITVVFVGNSGANKVMMTPWIMAHRIGHAIQAGQRMGRSQGPWRAAEEHFFTAINRILEDFYSKRSQSRYGVTPASMRGDLSKEYNALFNAIGTQRSSRTGQITRPYEFLYELFAQYLGTGAVTLKPLPKSQDYGRKAWGHSTQGMRLQPGAEEDSTYATEVLGRDMELMFDDVLSSLVGEILVM